MPSPSPGICPGRALAPEWSYALRHGHPGSGGSRCIHGWTPEHSVTAVAIPQPGRGHGRVQPRRCGIRSESSRGSGGRVERLVREGPSRSEQRAVKRGWRPRRGARRRAGQRRSAAACGARAGTRRGVPCTVDEDRCGTARRRRGETARICDLLTPANKDRLCHTMSSLGPAQYRTQRLAASSAYSPGLPPDSAAGPRTSSRTARKTLLPLDLEVAA